VQYFASADRARGKAAAALSRAGVFQLAEKMSTMMSRSQLVAQPSCAPCTALRSSSVRGQQLHLSQRLAKQTVRRVVSAAETKDKPKAPQKQEPKDSGPFKAPALDPSTPSPIFGGSTGGLLRMAQVGWLRYFDQSSRKGQMLVYSLNL